MFGCVIFGHSYKPRYSEKLPKGLTFKGKDPAQVAAQIEAAKLKVYEGDICPGCGSVVNRPFRSPMESLWSMMEPPANVEPPEVEA